MIYNMKREFVCIVCPKSCEITAEEDNGALRVTGNECEHGILFAEQEVYNPQRILTTTVKLATGELLPVRSRGTVKKSELKTLIGQLKNIIVVPPVEIGQVIVPSIGENSVEIVAADAACEQNPF